MYIEKGLYIRQIYYTSKIEKKINAHNLADGDKNLIYY